MKTSSLRKPVFFVLLLLLASPAAASPLPSTPYAEDAGHRAAELQNRLEEIKAIDKSTLSRADRKLLRREVREIKKELAAISGGVYLSVGALILIALLLILLL